MGNKAELRVGVIGAGRWANMAHLPGWKRDERVELVAVCDVAPGLAEEAGRKYDIPDVTDDARRLIENDDIDVIDVVTGDHSHFDLTMAALGAGKHVLVEKPVAHDFRDTLRARELAAEKDLKTKVGFTFRYSPAVRYMKELIDQGWVGTPYIYNAYEQNSQWIDPQTPLRQAPSDFESDRIRVSSLEGYGAPVIDLAHWFMDSDLTAVVGVLRNFVPERMIRDTGTMMRANIDDGDVFIGEFEGGAICSIQSSFVTVGNYPGIEVRVYGSEGALIARLVEEFGVMETLKGAKPDAVEFVDVEVPERLFPPGGTVNEAWPTLYYSNLTANFVDEILDGGDKNEGSFADAAWVQEVINAVEQSHHERGWVSLPLSR
jgi:predicted dehydrogenase